MPSDLERLEAAYPQGLEAMVEVLEGVPYLVMQRGHCAQLQVSGETLGCGIYAARPSVCRDLDRGSPLCLSERVHKVMSKDRLLSLRRAQR
jgi:Fe-S-cluster containining protein